MQVNSSIAKPFANLIRNASMINGCGICGIGVESIVMCKNLNTQSHILLAHLIKVECISVPSGINLYTVKLDKGPISLDMIFNCLKGVEYKKTSDTSKNIFIATDEVTFLVLTGTSSLTKPLTKDIISLYADKYFDKIYKLIDVAVPFLRENITYEICDNKDGTSSISFDSLTDNDVRNMLNNIIL